MQFRARHKDGSWRELEIFGINRLDDPSVGGVVINFRDITERKLGEERLRRSYEEIRALAARMESVREEESSRIARELHDEIGQALTAIKIHLQTLRRRSGRFGDRRGARREHRDVGTRSGAGAEPFAGSAPVGARRPRLGGRPALVPRPAIAALRLRRRVLGDLAPRAPPPRARDGVLPRRAAGRDKRGPARRRPRVSVELRQEGADLLPPDPGRRGRVRRGRAHVQARRGRSLGILGMEERVSLLGGMLTRSARSGGRHGSLRPFSPRSATSRRDSLMAAVRILIAEDHALVRAGLRKLLESIPGVEVVGEAGDGRDALAQVGSKSPEIALLDIAMPGLNGLEAAERIVAEHPGTRVILLSMHANEEYVLQALRAGRGGVHPEGLRPRGARARDPGRAARRHLPLPRRVQARGRVRAAHRRRADAAGKPDAAPARDSPADRRGLLDQAIAGTLWVSVKTIETHRSRSWRSSTSTTSRASCGTRSGSASCPRKARGFSPSNFRFPRLRADRPWAILLPWQIKTASSSRDG